MFIEYIKKSYHRILLEKILTKKSHLIGGKILDIGSKNRRYDNLFQEDVIAIDKNPKSEDIKKGDVEKGLDFSDESFSGILCIEVFEYLKDHESAIKEIHRLLESNGVAFISIPFMYHDHGDKMRFTKEFIVEKMKKYFSEAESFNLGNGFVIIWDILRKKVLSIKIKSIRYICFLFILPYLFFISIFGLWKVKDNFYSGIFLIVRK